MNIHKGLQMDYIPKEIVIHIITYVTEIKDICSLNKTCKFFSGITNKCIHTLNWNNKYNNLNILSFSNVEDVINGVDLHVPYDILYFLPLKKLRTIDFNFPTDILNYKSEFYDSVYQYLSLHNINYRDADIKFSCIWYTPGIEIDNSILIENGMLCFYDWCWDKTMKILTWGINTKSIIQIHIDVQIGHDKDLYDNIEKWTREGKIKKIEYYGNKKDVNIIVLNRDKY